MSGRRSSAPIGENAVIIISLLDCFAVRSNGVMENCNVLQGFEISLLLSCA